MVTEVNYKIVAGQNQKNQATCYNENMPENDLVSITEACQKLGVSIYIARHFCDAGYIPHIRRNRRYQRQLTPEQFELLAILVRMKQAGFSNSEIKRYAKLYRQGDAAAETRLAILTTKKHQLRQSIKAQQEAIDFIERQEEIYAEARAAELVN